MAREQVKHLGSEKARLVATYEKTIADVRQQLQEARSLASLKTAAEKAALEDKAAVSRSLRAALSRAEVADAKAAAASNECSVRNQLLNSVKLTSAKVGGWAKEASETVAKGSSDIARDAGAKLKEVVTDAPGYLHEMKGAAIRVFADLKADPSTVHPVG